MRKISANYVFTMTGTPLKNGVIFLNDEGRIIEIQDTEGKLRDSEKLEFYNGIIIPGLINCHCHLELSHMKGQIATQAGMDGFIDGIVHLRKADEADVVKAAQRADRVMQDEGIVAVGDISNNELSFEIKQKSRIYYHTFSEVFHPEEVHAEAEFARGLEVYNSAKNKYSLSASVVPHAPHTVSDKLFCLINEHALKTREIQSIHNQESQAENEYFIHAKGKLYDKLKQLRKEKFSWEKKNMTSLEYYHKFLPADNHTLLVHNTFSSKHDIEIASSYFKNLFWCLCPNSNLYIENSLPDILSFLGMKQTLVLGTDSLASNLQLSILEELKTVSLHFPEVTLGEQLKWVTCNGAKALQIDKEYGTLECGKKPGVVLLENMDLQNFKLTEKSRARILVR